VQVKLILRLLRLNIQRMHSNNSFRERIFNGQELKIESLALEVFYYQAIHNPVYKAYLLHLNIDVAQIKSTANIPYLPISFFKDAVVKSGDWVEERIFESSGTTQQTVKSRHFVRDISHYDKVCLQIFESVYGKVENCHILGLLPSYLEREGSSLVHMVDLMVKKSGSAYSGFYLYNHQSLFDQLIKLHNSKDGKKVVLIGVTFALLDFASEFNTKLEDVIVMETGGMKGRKEEMTRAEVHDFLKQRLGVNAIHSEYGMTELLSQAYSQKDGRYFVPKWMKVVTRDVNDPFADSGRRPGIIKVMDLANVDTCAFIETQDLGLLHEDGSFEVLGRIDNSEMRGCSLMAL